MVTTPSISVTPRFKAFPRPQGGVLVPTGDRATAAVGLCMYTASKSSAVRLQRLVHRAVSAMGASILPGRAQPFTLVDHDTWRMLTQSWRQHLGSATRFAVYRRRQAARTGLTLVLTSDERAPILVKVRDNQWALRREQAALEAVARARPRSFASPAPLGVHEVAPDLHWSAQSFVFQRPHSPVVRPHPDLFDDVQSCLKDLEVEPCAHHDLTPWNLRADHRGRHWLFDWEDWRPAPVGVDRVYFHVSARALLGTPMPAALPEPALDHVRTLVRDRVPGSHADEGLRAAMLVAVDEARRNDAGERPSMS